MLTKLSMLCEYIQSFLVIWLRYKPISMYDVQTYLSGFQIKANHIAMYQVLAEVLVGKSTLVIGKLPSHESI